MRYLLTILFSLSIMLCAGLVCLPYGPQAEMVGAYFDNNIQALCGHINNTLHKYLYLYEDDNEWHSYSYDFYALRYMCSLNDSILMISGGGGYYSDGVYRFNLNCHQFQETDYNYMSGMILHCDTDNYIYLCANGLYRTVTGEEWSHVPGLPEQTCTSMAYYANHYVVKIGTTTYYSPDAGVTWQSFNTFNLDKYRFTSDGTLYAIMNIGSESDGLYRSNDFGANWQVVIFSECLSAIGPDYQGYIPIGWNDPDGQNQGVALLSPQGELTNLNHEYLNTNIKEIDIFPVVNTPAFYVLTAQGCYFVTDFIPQHTSDQFIKPVIMQSFPNPAKTHSTICITGKTHRASVLRILNCKGQLVRTIPVSYCNESTPQNIDWNLLDKTGRKVASGIYLLDLITENRHILQGKLIVLP